MKEDMETVQRREELQASPFGDISYTAGIAAFPPSELEAFGEAADQILARLQRGIDQQSGYSGKGPFSIVLPSHAKPFDVAVIWNRFGITTQQNLRERSSVASGLKVFRIINDNVHTELTDEDAASLVLGGLGAEVIFMDRMGRIPTKKLNAGQDFPFSSILDEDPADHLSANPNQYDLIHLNSRGPSYLVPNITERGKDACNIALGKIQLLQSSLKPGGMVLLSVSDRDYLTELLEESDNRDTVLTDWKKQGVVVQAFPRYTLTYETFNPTRSQAIETPVLAVMKEQ